MSSGMQKPPVAPKPQGVPARRTEVCPSAPSAAKRVKPALAPKPCLCKVEPAVEPNSNLQRRARRDTLNAQNSIQQENKKPDWDYVIPICLCSQKSCVCGWSAAQRRNSRKTRAKEGGQQDHCESSGSVLLSNLSLLQNTPVFDGGTTRAPRADGETTIAPAGPSPRPPVQAARGRAVPVPLPRKPRRAALQQGKAQEDEEDPDLSVGDGKVSPGQKGRTSSSAGQPKSQTGPLHPPLEPPQPLPASPPRMALYLSAPHNTPAPPSAPPGDVVEEDLDWDSSTYGMEVSVDREDEEEGRANCEAPDDNLQESPSSSSSPPQPLTEAVDAAAREAPLKPHRYNTATVWTQKAGSSPGGEEAKRRVAREAPTPKGKPTNAGAPGDSRPSRSSLNKQKAKSFSGADLIQGEGPRRNSFRKLLELRLSVKILPKLLVKGTQASDARGDQQQSRRPERKLSCPPLGLELSIEREDISLAVEPDGVYENVRHYEEIPDYVNVRAAGAGTSVPLGFGDHDDNGDGIYEQPEPFASPERSSELWLQQRGRNRSPDSEEPFTIGGGSSSSSSDEEEGSSSLVSSKGDPEQPEETLLRAEQKKSKIQHIATEIMSSEKVFVDVLKLLHVDFREAVLQATRPDGKLVMEDRVLNQILYYLPQLYELNRDLLQELQSRVAKWDENAKLADIFLKKGPYLKMYATYIREFDRNVALLEEQTRKNPAFGAVVRDFEADPSCANLALKHYLLKPVQRIPQYQLLLTDYLKNLSEDSADYRDTQAALAIVKEVANHANDIMKQGDIFQKLIQVQCSLNGHHEIVQPGRIFLKEGILMKLSRKVMQPRMFFLFNDMLLYTTPLQSGQYKLNNMLSLAGMKVSKPSQEAYQNELNIESVERSFILSASSASKRDEWLRAISAAIGDHARKKVTFIAGKSQEEDEPSSGGDAATLGSKAPIWIPDPRTTMCMICTCEFTLTWRRHHCRACGKVVCQSCSSNKHCLEYLKNQLARVCDQCFHVLQDQKTEQVLAAAVSPSSRATFAFSRKQKKIPAALKEVTANADDSSMSGYLQRSKGRKKQAKRLWFVIKDKVLYTYAASEDVAALESQPLLGFVLKVDSSQKFKLYHKNTLYYVFKADDIPTGKRWIDSFKESTVL